VSGRDPLANPEALIPQVYGYVAYRIGTGPDAADVTSETFERAVRYRTSYDARKGPPIAWLLAIARRCTNDWIAGRPPTAVELHEVGGGGEFAEEVARRLDLDSAVALLNERDRELIALRYGTDLKARQIAELLGERTNTIEVAISRALDRLREHLESPPPTRPADEAHPRSTSDSPV
jgi:RNA polymerase sigma-70 factor (ECF subfamily)